MLATRRAFWILWLLVCPLWAQEDYELSYLLVRSDNGQVLAHQEEAKLRTPASTMKILTAAAALETLGSQHRYSTTVWAAGQPQRGRLRGDLNLKGEADPELTEAALQDLARQLHSQGLRRVQGDMVIDEGEFAWPPYGPGWAWDDTGEGYSPEVTGLALNGGVVTLTPDFQAPWLHREPSEQNSTYLIPGRAGAIVQGELPASLAPPCSSLRTGERFVEILKLHGIHLNGTVRAGKARGQILATHQSRTLQEILSQAMAASDNLAMELIHRSTGGVLPQTLEGRKLRKADGSGLSRYNLISATQLVEVLRSHPDLKPILPGPGEGTLKQRFLTGAAGGKIRAKTGTLGNVSGLAGYLFPETAEEMVFAILINGHLDSTTQRKSLENGLVESWAQEFARR